MHHPIRLHAPCRMLGRCRAPESLMNANRPAPALNFPPGIDREIFLREYWQKRPLLMRAAVPVDSFRLTPDELAGLACEPEFESRLIIEHGSQDWEVRHGPLSDTDFAALPDSHWTLLVQDVDKYLPDVARLIDGFDFVPSWRIDDIMVSYATDQGGVGPHTDAYDVFLMQAAGRRRWRLSYRQYGDQDLLPELEQRILSNFDTDEDWVLEPGDILYLPPGVAHWGTAKDECMTYSLGFRAPNQHELASDWFQHLVALAGEQRLQDPDDLYMDSLTELTEGARNEAAKLLDSLPSTQTVDFQLWLGRYLTEPKPQFQILPPDDTWDATDLQNWIALGGALVRHPFARVAWASLNDGRVALFSQGESLLQPDSARELFKHLAERRRLDATDLTTLLATSPVAAATLLSLRNEGLLESYEEGS